MKLSGSPRILGSFNVKIVRVKIRIIDSRVSLIENYGWNGIYECFC